MKTIITLALAFIGTFSFGSDGDTLTKNFKKGIVIKQGIKDTFLVVTYNITTTDTVKVKEYREQIQRLELANKANTESRKIQNAEFDRLEKYYLAEIKRLKAEKKKTD